MEKFNVSRGKAGWSQSLKRGQENRGKVVHRSKSVWTKKPVKASRSWARSTSIIHWCRKQDRSNHRDGRSQGKFSRSNSNPLVFHPSSLAKYYEDWLRRLCIARQLLHSERWDHGPDHFWHAPGGGSTRSNQGRGRQVWDAAPKKRP